ncbi:MAG: Spy/CpxP family protein refolding chaperone [Halanaerobium sp.]
MKKLLTVFLVLTFVLTAFVGMTYAKGSQGKYGRVNSDEARSYGTAYRQIELTESQIDKISEYRAEFYDESEELRDQLRELNWELRDLYLKNASNEEMGRIKDEIEVVAEDLSQMRAANQDKIKSILTDEQLEIIEENRTSSQNRFDDHRFGRFNKDSQSGPGMMNRKSGSRNFQGRNFDGHGPGFCH